MSEDPTASEFTRLLAYLKASRGFDFSAYKVSSLMRRIQKRMREIGVESYAEYSDYLEVHPNEFEPLFDTVLINATSFFRDPASWRHLQEKILPRLLEEREPGRRPLRVWSAGCASGEEALSLAMVLAEVMGEEDFGQRVKIYATDVDERALAAARQASYEARQVSGVPQALLDKYFERNAGRLVFRSDLRRSIIFGRHDLIQDAAISRLDLLVCRNTLMYFNAETQEKILARFHFALNKQGYLFLGKAETLLTHTNSFRPLDLKHRVFTRAPIANSRERLLAFSAPGAPAAETNGVSARPLRLREAAFDTGQVAQIVLDDRSYLVLANEKARQLFGLGERDLGRVVQDLELSYRPVELRSCLDEAYAKRSPVLLRDVQWHGVDGQIRTFEVQIVPLLDGKAGLLGASVSFQDLTHSHQLQAALARTHQELETAYEALQSANEELETTNEELQSTVEELETTNEELQSANEELETMNEELQSTNEVLRATNDQLQQSSDELNLLNVYLESILSSLRSAVVVLDRNLQVKLWSPKAEELWGARASETKGQAFLDLDIGLPVRELRQPLLQCLEGNAPPDRTIVLDGVNRRGKPVQCEVQCMPLRSSKATTGVIVLVDEAELS